MNDLMATVNRKITYRLYPNPAQTAALHQTLALHCRLYNTLLEEHQRHHRDRLGPFGFTEMCKALTAWRREAGALAALNAQSLQVTAKRAALAYQAFFRRVKAGDTPGYPRFKSAHRFKGFGYKTHGDGWRLTLAEKHGYVRLAGIGLLKIRGRGRFQGTPKTAEVVHKQGRWHLSVTFVVEDAAVRRPVSADRQAAAFDLGLETLVTLALADGTLKTVANPRWLTRRLAALKTVQQAAAAEQERLNAAAGLPTPLPKGACPPVNGKLRRLRRQAGAIAAKVARQRHAFLHQLSAVLVQRFDALVTEELDVATLVRRPHPDPQPDGTFAPNGAERTTGLRRAMHDAAPATLLTMLAYKAEEAGSRLHQAPTKELKPTQRCHACGAVAKKALAERRHVCACGASCGRDENAALTLLRWFKESPFWPGTGQATPHAA